MQRAMHGLLCWAGYVYKYDLSIPLAQMYDLVAEMRSRLSRFRGEGVRVVRERGWGQHDQ